MYLFSPELCCYAIIIIVLIIIIIIIIIIKSFPFLLLKYNCSLLEKQMFLTAPSSHSCCFVWFSV